jgi:ADP-ribose pyrophosphatase
VTDEIRDTPEPSGGPPTGTRRPAVDVSATKPTVEDLTERVVSTEVLHTGHYLDLRIDTIERPDGSTARREIVGHPGAVAIIAIDPNDQVLLVRQFRLPAGRVLLEIPAGTLDKDAATGEIEDPDVAAARELEEETGYRAGRWQKLASFWTAPGFATENMHLYLATELTPAHTDRLGPDDDERLLLDRLPFDEAVEALERGVIADAKSMVGLLWVARTRAR